MDSIQSISTKLILDLELTKFPNDLSRHELVRLWFWIASLSMRSFWAADGNWKWNVFFFNSFCHYHLYIGKYISSIKDDIRLEIWESLLPWHAKRHSRLPPAAEKRLVLKLPIEFYKLHVVG